MQTWADKLRFLIDISYDIPIPCRYSRQTPCPAKCDGLKRGPAAAPR